ncbi:MAG: Transcriptional regulator, AsnC family [Firmicutes bacterium]|nr:Transcriptional regulator, AsnC family [Bacillota bacterium]
MDNIDLRIIELLKGNSRMTSSEISRKIQLSIPAVSERIRKLEESKVIEQYTVILNRSKLGLCLMAFVLVNVDPQHLSKFRQKVGEMDAVLECHHIAGESDYLLKVAVESTSDLERFITKKLKEELSAAKTNTIVVLSTLKEQI